MQAHLQENIFRPFFVFIAVKDSFVWTQMVQRRTSQPRELHMIHWHGADDPWVTLNFDGSMLRPS
ncbi:hypothetical protein LINGRAHAP2_LOCUS24817, partial [Linum grandiflorum]